MEMVMVLIVLILLIAVFVYWVQFMFHVWENDGLIPTLLVLFFPVVGLYFFYRDWDELKVNFVFVWVVPFCLFFGMSDGTTAFHKLI
ncbi:hypothetical protein [Acanthopleuribacter pedis]|uniref:Transmembrane protein n=1 Tax=Acanthopleuribacter pedis TaxID=442870 RepID=A0A8J7QF65_9BACT|nr:hypothetical protein [Acanthopleuribacter pedis]MBO1322924.1 hypothetical protein [Acanthopleuribacter pedis]